MNKKIKPLFIILLCFFSILLPLFSGVITSFALESQSYVVMERDSNRVLYQSNASQKKYMASTTKILTAITIIENCNVNDIVSITKKTIGIEGSSIYLRENEKLSVLDLLYGLMLRSGNDCAETLAVYCSGTIENFAELMNSTAKRVGANDSNFVNPHGLHDDNHYTTAYDLALISCYAMKNQTFREIVSTKKIRIADKESGYVRLLINKNKMLTQFDNSTGIKTGYTKKAGRCLVSSCLRDNMEVICVVLNCPPMWEKSMELLTLAFNNYKNYTLVDSENIIGFIKCLENGKGYSLIIKDNLTLPLTDAEKESIKIQYNYPKEIEKVSQLQGNIGEVSIYSQNNLIFSKKIYNII